MPVFFWTDILIFLLIALAIGFALYASGKEHLRLPWREVGRSPMAMSALVVLAVYVVIGVLDSIHYKPALDNGDGSGKTQYSSEVLSLFDRLTTGMRERQEKTYSAPFAIHSFSKEMVELPDGTQQRQFPRLVYGGAHLADSGEKLGDIAGIVIRASVKAVASWVLLCLIVALVLARRRGLAVREIPGNLIAGHAALSWRTILFSLLAVIVLGWTAFDLSQQYHILGTDKIGDDVFYQSLKSIRTGLVIGTLTTLVMLPFAIVLGLMAGYFGGWVDDMIQYLYTTLNSIPSVLLIAAAILMMQVYIDNNAAEFTSAAERADLRLLFLCLILGVTSWTGLCRYLRAESLKLREIDYVQSAVALGVGHAAIIARHVLPNVMHIVLITVVLDFSGLVLAEAVLSYVQIGVDPTTNSWGNMINSARLEMAREPVVWWSLAAAFIFMFTLVLAANLFSDAVRDAFDPRLRAGPT